MLAVDAATEMRSMTLLYERWADRIYRYFLLSTGDPETAERMMRDLMVRLPTELQKFASEERTFGGWLFTHASEVFWREYSFASRFYRRASRYLPARSGSGSQDHVDDQHSAAPAFTEFDEMLVALRGIPADRREVLAIHYGAELKTISCSEALRLPASLLSSHIQWALESLAEQLDVRNTRRLAEDLSELVNRETLSNQQRQRHFSLIHGTFTGDVIPDAEEPERAPLFEIGALIGVVVLGLLGIWIWGLITEGDTRQHEVASPPVEMASEPDPTPTPVAEPTPDNDVVEPPGDQPASCMAAEGKAYFDSFINSYNNGDFGAVSDMLPGVVESVASDDATDDEPFFLHREASLDDPVEVSSFLRERYGAGERWDVLEAYPAEHYRNWESAALLEMYQDWKRENPGLSMIIVAGLDWSGEQDDAEIARGRVLIDCESGDVIGWDVQSYGEEQNPDPVSLSEYLTAMEPLQAGESREIRTRVRVERRVDGGLLSTWELAWSEAVNDDGTVSERIDVRTLDGGDEIDFVLNGDRWRLNQRGWVVHSGDEELPLPHEITTAMPWLRQLPEIMETLEIPDELDGASLTFGRDVSDEGATGIERTLQVDIDDGNLGAITVTEDGPAGSHVIPEIHVLSVERNESFDPETYQVPSEPDFPELETGVPRFEVPVDEWEQLELIEVVAGQSQMSETYLIRWNDVEIPLTVSPSLGGLDVGSIPVNIDESWTTAATDYRWGLLVWAHRQFSGYPTDAVWDDGRYRYTVSLDRDAISNDHKWSLRELIRLADALSVEPEVPDDEASESGDGGNALLSRARL